MSWGGGGGGRSNDLKLVGNEERNFSNFAQALEVGCATGIL